MKPLLTLLAVLTLAACTPEDIVRAIFHEDPDRAVDIAWCESRLDPDAVSPGGGNHGLMQINVVHRSSFERVLARPWSDIYDPAANTAFAHWLWERQGWRPWSCA